MRSCLVAAAIVSGFTQMALAADAPRLPMPEVPVGWKIEQVTQAPAILFPTAISTASDGSLFVGSDPMDMPGPPTVPSDRVLRIKDGKITTFADNLWSVMGIECVDDTVFVVHAPYLSAFKDTNRDGRADSRVDLITGLGPTPPGFNGINDHIASGIRLATDGYLYISVGDKGIPKAVGRDGTTLRLFGGGVIRLRPDGTGLEVVSTGERNPLSVAISATDELFSYGNDDDSKKWPNSLTHHIVGGHYGYPYQFVATPERALPIMMGTMGGSGAQGLCYNEDGLPDEYRGNLFFCDWGLQSVIRFEIRKAGGTHAVARRSPFVTKGDLKDFRPFSLAVSSDGTAFWLVDWGFNGWLADGPQTGRIFRIHYTGPNPATPAARPSSDDITTRLQSLDHPALSVRLESQRMLSRANTTAIDPLRKRLAMTDQAPGRHHALWALDAIGGSEARQAIAQSLTDESPRIRLQAARSAGIHRDVAALSSILPLLKDRDAAVRREAAIALGRLGDRTAAPALYRALGDSDTFAAWSIRQAIRQLEAWDKASIVTALLDDRRTESALRLTDEAWAIPVIEALTDAFSKAKNPAVRRRIVSNIAGLYRRYPEWSGYWFGTNPLAGRYPDKTQDWSPEGMTRVIHGLAIGLVDPDAAVRATAISGLAQAGIIAAPLLRIALQRETAASNLTTLAETLGKLADAASAPSLAALATDANRAEAVRIAAVDALNQFRDPESLRTRFSLIYDPATPPFLIAHALPTLARGGTLPANDLVTFFESPAPAVRAAAILSINVKKPIPPELKQAVVDRLTDPDAAVRRAAIAATGPLQIRQAIPTLLAISQKPGSPDRDTAIMALCAMPDQRSVSAYLAAIEDANPALVRAGESALLSIRDQVADLLATSARSKSLSPSASAALTRVLARFVPVTDWQLIGPFPRTTPRVFIGEKSIDFAKRHPGAGGRTIEWKTQKADPATGRLDLESFNRNSGQTGDFGYDQNGSPDLSAFAFAQIQSPADRKVLLLLGSSGSLLVTVNEAIVYQFKNVAGRGYEPDTDMVKLTLPKGPSRILVQSRQGIGRWSFGLQIADDPGLTKDDPAPETGNQLEALRTFALGHNGDARRGEQLFFEHRATSCGRCHSAAGRGNANIGPDLTGLASKYDRAEIIRSILEPSNRIATGYQSVNLATQDGKVVTGVIRSESDATLELSTSEGNITRLSKSTIEDRRPSQTSIMPEGLASSLSTGEFADLVSYLTSLEQPAQAPPHAQETR